MLFLAASTFLSLGLGSLTYREDYLPRKLAGGALYFVGFTCMFLTLLVGV